MNRVHDITKKLIWGLAVKFLLKYLQYNFCFIIGYKHYVMYNKE